ncbi:type II toxin-antitoxin system VapC family toxin [Synoicihabitans lomoniglobus]|uniref:Type II toxin-antitoxin system VapC family toxin n=1 Tax=Synoicihabitans lomoniglobus TaxID=2909285 RepID=A0AAF0CSM0_9BACT|nr:type II toxin-antitoxin system VapC family toxin [Opitutaceae bacterium LMO-M01]WED67295.1 type II toxin-antitoxin system VapC family toxin [Opitutaceae bacterium LMO-M01]
MSESAAYIDTSCLLKLLFPEPESAAVAGLIAEEAEVVVSALARVEAEQQIVARRLGGFFNLNRQRKVQTELRRLLELDPFVTPPSGGTLWDLALNQVAKAKVQCRTLDRLHLASMAELGITRLITHDKRQAAAARDLGFEVIMPE